VVTVIRTDSSAFLDVIGDLQSDLLASWQTADSLYTILHDTDTSCAKYAGIIRKLQEDNKRVQKKVITLPPVHDTVRITKKVRDTAADQVTTDNLEDCTAKLQKETDKKEAWMKSALITWALLLLLILAMYLYKRFFNNKK
jgi:hypothetical protein